MKLTTEQIEQIARLARLEVSDAEKAMYAEQLSDVLEYMKILDEVDTSAVEETTQVTGLEDVVREDKVVPVDPAMHQRLLACFPSADGDLLRVKGVFE